MMPGADPGDTQAAAEGGAEDRGCRLHEVNEAFASVPMA
jgi:hypothetical protein